jgi:hypothetical protein
VRDASGAVVPGAEVGALNAETGVKRTATTDAQGFYSFQALPVGTYEVEVTMTGFKRYRQTALVLEVNSALTVDVRLQLGEVRQEVTVSTTAVQVETATSHLGELIDGQEMSAMPLNGRSYVDLLALQPGVVPANSGVNPTGETSAPAQNSSLTAAGNLSISGQRETANSFMVNGALVEEVVQQGTAIDPNLDSIAEFRILTSGYEAEYGNYSGGQVNIATKSGTNQFHGDGFEFLRNGNLDARNFYSATRGAFHPEPVWWDVWRAHPPRPGVLLRRLPGDTASDWRGHRRGASPLHAGSDRQPIRHRQLFNRNG